MKNDKYEIAQALIERLETAQTMHGLIVVQYALRSHYCESFSNFECKVVNTYRIRAYELMQSIKMLKDTLRIMKEREEI